jgi:hypothetical protein
MTESVSQEGIIVLKQLAEIPIEKIQGIKLSGSIQEELRRLLAGVIEHYAEKPLRSARVVENILTSV